MIDWRPIIRRQKAAFELKFGRKPEKGDPVFFDPNAEGTKPVGLDRVNGFAAMLKLCEEARMPGHLIHAIKITRATPMGDLPSGWDDARMTGWKLHARKENAKCDCNVV